MELIGALMTLMFAAVMFTVMAVLFTCPGWIIGTLAGAGGMQVPVNPLVSTRWRRRILWALSSLGMALVTGIAYRKASPGLLLLWPVFFAAGQYFAFYLGYTRAAARKARRDNEEPVTGWGGPPTQVVRADDTRVIAVGGDSTRPFSMPAPRVHSGDEYQPASPMGGDDYQPATPTDVDQG